MPSKTEDQKRPLRPAQHQDRQPGLERDLRPRPRTESAPYRAAGKLKGRTALITGGDSGIGRAVALAFAQEGADVAISYLNEDADADEARRFVERHGRRCITLRGDISRERHCRAIVHDALDAFDHLDIVVNNAAVQWQRESIADITEDQLRRTFETNIFAMFYTVKAALPALRESGRASIINTTSVTAYRGSKSLVDYAATKGAIVAFTRSLSAQLVEDHIRVNAVAPGPIWTPLIPATKPADEVAEFGSDVPMKRAGEPAEVAPAFVFLASDDASYITGQVIHVNGGEVVNG